MDTGFRRLWTRRKSKGRPQEAVEDGVPDVSKTPQTALVNARPQGDISWDGGSKNTTNTAGLQGFRRILSPEEHSATRSPGKIQPMLVGVSRPSTTISRPGTSGSLQNAVDQAAESVSQGRPSFQNSRQEPVKGHTRTKSPRYIDIFSIASPTHKPSPSYNEDIAERNLDLLRVALEGTQYRYVPSSRYQEEVALRNAYPPGTQRPSIEVARPSREELRRNVQDNGSERGATGPGGLHSYTNQQSTDMNASKSRTLPDSAAYHSRQYSMRSRDPGTRDSGTQLPAIPQEHASEDGSNNGDPPEGHKRTRSNATEVPINDSSKRVRERSRDAPTMAADNGVQRMPPSREVAPMHRLVTQMTENDYPTTMPHNGMRQYAVSPSQAVPVSSVSEHGSMRHQSSHSRGRPLDLPRMQDGSSIRSPSAMSQSSALKKSLNLPNRTVMDLTGDDAEVFSDGGYAASDYSEASVVEHAMPDTTRRTEASVGSPIERTTMLMSNTEDDETQSADLVVRPENKRSRASSDTLQSARSDLTERYPSLRRSSGKKPSMTAFSPITTVASLPPQARLDGEGAASSPFGHDSQSTMATEAKGGTDSVVNTTEDKATPIGPASETTVHRSYNSSASQAEDRASTPSRSAVARDRAQSNVSAASQSQSGTPARSSTPRFIHNSPESLKSSDFVHPSKAFGVLTRDFAATPNKTMASLQGPILRENLMHSARKPGTRSVAGSRSVSREPTARPRMKTAASHNYTYTSTFDEVEFAKKQNEARAALIKLQASLDENFNAPAAPKRSVSPRPVLARNGDSISDGRPIAPSSIFAQVRNPPLSHSQVNADTASFRPSLAYQELLSESSGSIVTLKSLRREKTMERMRALERMASDMSITRIPSPPKASDPARHIPSSPAELSLPVSPLPAASPQQSASLAPNGDRFSRRGSTNSHKSFRSQTSTASAFSIPHHMVPDRSSSMRDHLALEEEDEANFDL